MALTISSDAIGALKPVTIPDGADLKYENHELTWPAQDESTGRIKPEEIIFIAKNSQDGAGYVIFTLKQGSQDGEEEPFALSTFSAHNLSQDMLNQYLLKSAPEFLRSDAIGSLDVIVSGGSGTGLAQKFFSLVLQPLLDMLGLTENATSSTPVSEPAKKQYQVTVTKGSDTIKEFAQQRWGSQSSKGGNGQTIILLSGDGGVVDLLNGSADATTATETRPVIALLPLGTGNALFHSLHRPHYANTNHPVPSPFVLGLRTIFKGSAAPLPTFQASFSPGSHLISYSDTPDQHQEELPAAVSRLIGAIVASYGFHSQLVWESDTPDYRVHGDKRFGMVAQELLKESHTYNAVVETQSSSSESPKRLQNEKFNYILATMVSNLEKTFTISPANAPLDGQLRLVHLGDVGGAKTMEVMMKAYDGGKHVGMQWTTDDGREEQVGYDAVDEVKVTILENDGRWRKVCIDGTIVEIPEGGSITVTKSREPQFWVLVDI